MDWKTWIFAFVCFLFALYIRNLVSAISGEKQLSPHYVLKIVSGAFLIAVALTIILTMKLPLYILYILLFLIVCLDSKAILKIHEFQRWFWASFVFTSLTIPHLIFLSAISICNRKYLWETYHSSGLWMLAVFLALGTEAVILLCVNKEAVTGDLYHLLKDAKRLKQLVIFQWFMVVYIFFDSVLFTFHLSYGLLSWFLLGSSLILVQQFYIFFNNTYAIALNAYKEADYEHLQKERERHLQEEAALNKIAYRDNLTGAYSRRYAMEQLDKRLSAEEELLLVYIDLNKLKDVNDMYGHPAGDQYLLQVVVALKKHLREEDIIARMGGDEFLVIASEISEQELDDAMQLANQELKEKIQEYQASFAYGMIHIEAGHKVSVRELLTAADKKMYEQKKAMRRRGS